MRRGRRQCRRWHHPLLISGLWPLTELLRLRLPRLNPLLLSFLRGIVSRLLNLRSLNLLPQCRRRAEWRSNRLQVLAGKRREFLSRRQEWRPLLRRSLRSGLARMTRGGRVGLRFR